VGAQTGSTDYQWIEDNLVKNHTGVKVHPYAEDTTALQDLKIGRLQATVTDSDTGQKFIEKNPNSVRLAGQINSYPPEVYALAVQKGGAHGLLATLNKGIVKLYKSGEWAKIVHKYMPGASIGAVPAYMSSKIPTYRKPIPGLNGSN